MAKQGRMSRAKCPRVMTELLRYDLNQHTSLSQGARRLASRCCSSWQCTWPRLGSPKVPLGRNEIIGWHYLANATCLIQASLVSCVLRRVKDQYNLLYHSPRLKNTCVRQVVLDTWFLLKSAGACSNSSPCGTWFASRCRAVKRG